MLKCSERLSGGCKLLRRTRSLHLHLWPIFSNSTEIWDSTIMMISASYRTSGGALTPSSALPQASLRWLSSLTRNKYIDIKECTDDWHRGIFVLYRRWRLSTGLVCGQRSVSRKPLMGGKLSARRPWNEGSEFIETFHALLFILHNIITTDKKMLPCKSGLQQPAAISQARHSPG